TLKELSNEADRLQSSKAFSTEHTMWVTKCLDTLEEIFGRASMYFVSFRALRWYESQSFIIDSWDAQTEQTAIDTKHHTAFLRHLGVAKGLLLGAVNFLAERELCDVYNAKDTGPEASLILKVLRLAERQLRKVIREKPDNEKQIQDAFENLLIGADISYGREVDRIEYSSKTYTPDFSLQKISLAVEVKLCKRSEREKELPEEINDDILAYQTKYANLLFIVYDLGYIRDTDRFCGSFEEHENVTIRVVKH
ncbi:hypothetical protein ACFL4C_03630, partial [Candidatus Omnitrophota bacterium]